MSNEADGGFQDEGMEGGNTQEEAIEQIAKANASVSLEQSATESSIGGGEVATLDVNGDLSATTTSNNVNGTAAVNFD